MTLQVRAVYLLRKVCFEKVVFDICLSSFLFLNVFLFEKAFFLKKGVLLRMFFEKFCFPEVCITLGKSRSE